MAGLARWKEKVPLDWRQVEREGEMKQQHLKGKRDEKALTTQKDNPQEGALSDELRERIAKRAYEFYLQRGWRDGCALEDWVDAERGLLTVPRGEE